MHLSTAIRFFRIFLKSSKNGEINTLTFVTRLFEKTFRITRTRSRPTNVKYIYLYIYIGTQYAERHWNETFNNNILCKYVLKIISRKSAVVLWVNRCVLKTDSTLKSHTLRARFVVGLYYIYGQRRDRSNGTKRW